MTLLTCDPVCCICRRDNDDFYTYQNNSVTINQGDLECEQPQVVKNRGQCRVAAKRNHWPDCKPQYGSRNH